MMRWLVLSIVVAGCGNSEPASPGHGSASKGAGPTDMEKSNTTRIAFGDGSLALPDGWSETKHESDRLTFRSAEQTEQATISKMDFAKAPSFEDFKRLSELRLKAETEASGGAVETVTGPSNDGGEYTFFFSGTEKANQRLFSGYMIVVGKTLTTVYIEGVGVTPERHLASFKAFVTGYQPGRASGSAS
jgi:hypothetical protein